MSRAIKYRILFQLNDDGEKRIVVEELDGGLFGVWGCVYSLRGPFKDEPAAVAQAVEWVRDAIKRKANNAAWTKRPAIYLDIHGAIKP